MNDHIDYIPATIGGGGAAPGDAFTESVSLNVIVPDANNPVLEAPRTLPALLAWWDFEEGSGGTSADLSGNGHTLTVAAGMSFTNDHQRGAKGMNFANNARGACASPFSSTASWTIAFWIKPHAVGGLADGIVATSDKGVFISNSGGAKVSFFSSSHNYHDTALALEEWTHIVIVNDDGKLAFFRNGVADGTTTTGGNTFTISGLGDDFSDSQFLDAILDDVRVYGGVLFHGEILEIMRGNVPTDFVLGENAGLHFDIALAVADSSAEPTEAVTASISGSDLSDSNAAPTEARTALLRVWLSGSAGTDVASPGNANGQNDAANAVVSTAALASNPETMTSDIGVNVPGGITFSSAIYRGWFRARTTLSTSTAEIIAHSTTAAFADIVMFTQSTIGGDTNHLGGTFTFDLVAAGVDTLAKLQSLQVLHRCTDAAAGVTPAILDVDAGAADIVATSI